METLRDIVLTFWGTGIVFLNREESHLMATPTTGTLNPDRTGKPGGPLRYMTIEEYARLPEVEDGYTCELVQGMVVREPGPAWSHRLLQFKLGRYLHAWIEKAGQGEVGLEGDCILSENPDTVRVPDVAVLLQRRFFDNEPGGWIRGAPDIAIEVLSPSNTSRQMRERIDDYFGAGALRVWIVDPTAHTVVIHRPDGTLTLFEDGDCLEDPEVLPDFVLDIAELFER